MLNPPVTCRFRLLLFLVLFAGWTVTVSAQRDKQLLQEGKELYQKGLYKQALSPLLRYFSNHGSDAEAQQMVGVCYFFTNNLIKAREHLEELRQNKKADPKTHYYLARVYHAQLEFEKAADQYKSFLRISKPDDPGRASVKDDLRRCAEGIRLKFQESPALVETLGEAVNSEEDEFAPYPSPSYNERLYYSAVRVPMTEEGQYNGNPNADIRVASSSSGIWSDQGYLRAESVNSNYHEVLEGISKDGNILYYLRSSNLFSGVQMTDTFGRSPSTGQLDAPINANSGDQHLFFYQDTLLLFSSRRPGGQGAYDLWWTARRDGQWTQPENLGGSINTPYDETTPFLARDGKTLYFSSNNPKSIGGFDIFKTYWNLETQSWAPPVNLGMPINSSADDTYFKLSADGKTGFFASSRKDGLGKRDLYAAYFKDEQLEQLSAESYPFTSGGPGKDTLRAFVPQVNKVVLQPLFYTTDQDVLGRANQEKLEGLTTHFLQYPSLQLLIQVHGTEKKQPGLDEYFTVKTGETVARYLISKGLPAHQIKVRGLGARYLKFKSTNEQGPIPGAIRNNRRVDLLVAGQEGLPVQFESATPVSQAFDLTSGGKKLEELNKGLSYRIKLAEVKQRYNSNIFAEYEDMSIDFDPKTNVFTYTVGWYKKFDQAWTAFNALKAKGGNSTEILPYINGVSITREQAILLVDKYTELAVYLNRVDTKN